MSAVCVVLRSDVCNVRSVSHLLVGPLLLLLQRLATCSVLDWRRHPHWSVPWNATIYCLMLLSWYCNIIIVYSIIILLSEIETRLSDSGVGNNSVADHRIRRPVLSLHCVTVSTDVMSDHTGCWGASCGGGYSKTSAYTDLLRNLCRLWLTTVNNMN